MFTTCQSSLEHFAHKRDKLRRKCIEALRLVSPLENESNVLERLAELLRNVAEAWKDAGQEQKNRLAGQLFDEIWVKDKQVIAVKPRPELKPFFQLSYEEWLKKFESENSDPPGVASIKLSVILLGPANNSIAHPTDPHHSQHIVHPDYVGAPSDTNSHRRCGTFQTLLGG
jgi:hypothetical protein